MPASPIETICTIVVVLCSGYLVCPAAAAGVVRVHWAQLWWRYLLALGDRLARLEASP